MTGLRRIGGIEDIIDFDCRIQNLAKLLNRQGLLEIVRKHKTNS